VLAGGRGHEGSLSHRASLRGNSHDLQPGGRIDVMRAEVNAPTRVLFLLATLDGGAAERTVLTLLPHLRARGVDARVRLLARRGGLDREVEPNPRARTRTAPDWVS